MEKKAARKLKQALSPFAEFARDQTTASIILVVSTLVALIWANSRYADAYHDLFATVLGIHLGHHSINLNIQQWISEGLMTLFFFFLGLEIKRELIAGELRDWQRSLPVLLAAAGGMLFPALFYYVTSQLLDGNSRAWGVPMATDTAFAIGILALLKARIPASLVLFVTALAIIDDIGAMLIIAVAYTEDVKLVPVMRAITLTGVLLLLNWVGVRRAWAYLFGGIWIWLELHTAGIHSTLAGVLVAATVPARSEVSPRYFLRNVPRSLRKFSYLNKKKRDQDTLSDDEQHRAVTEVASQAERAVTPLRRWEHFFEKPITLLVMPLFALANAGITFQPEFFSRLITNGASVGIFTGLVFGKSIGIVTMTFLCLRMGWGKLADDVTIKHIVGIGLIAGIGFTMSILMAKLAFGDDGDGLKIAKSAVLLASLTAGLLGYFWLRWTSPAKPQHEHSYEHGYEDSQEHSHELRQEHSHEHRQEHSHEHSEDRS